MRRRYDAAVTGDGGIHGQDQLEQAVTCGPVQLEDLLLLAGLVSGYLAVGAGLNRALVRAPDPGLTLRHKLRESRHLIRFSK